MASRSETSNTDSHPHLDDAARNARMGATWLGHIASRAVGTTQARAGEATTALQALPDSALRDLVATSVGLGVGLFLTRQPRLVVAAGIIPAMLAILAIRGRPGLPALRPISIGDLGLPAAPTA
jgi:hypothetical protein